MYAIFDLDEDPETQHDHLIEWQGGAYCAVRLEHITDHPERGIVLTWNEKTVDLGPGKIIQSDRRQMPKYWDAVK